MISPSGSTGAKIAERAPITIRARPWRILCHSSWRSPGGQMAVQHRHQRLHAARAEPRLEPLDRLRRQRNLRHQHDRAFALLQRVVDRLQVDLRLAAAGDAVQQEHRGEARPGVRCLQRRLPGLAVAASCRGPRSCPHRPSIPAMISASAFSWAGFSGSGWLGRICSRA